jgi:hypothetical protein
MIDVAVIERPRIDDQLPCFLVRALKVDFRRLRYAHFPKR